ncbi:MAG TPA: hypothetical protein VFC85_08250 [Verrucomicrobiae bacterium]|nr:hypothetical protein [Verrucomicrobiae bacterium]
MKKQIGDRQDACPAKMENFEQKISRQPLKKIPGEWRAEILAAAIGRGSRIESRRQESRWPSTFAARLSTIFWPHPKAWAALAAIWIFIFTLNFSTRDKSQNVAEKFSPPSPEVIVELKKQRQMFAELMGSNETRIADRQKIFFSRPQSERMEILTA